MRKFSCFGVSCLLLTLGAASAATDRPAPTEPGEAAYLTHVRQLIYDGKRSGEGYFSPDGTRLVFQSERDPENPFYQIFELDLTDGATRRISTGTGKTTCAFYRDRGGAILYASTHHDPRSKQLQQQELDFRASGQERRYAWDYDPEMELYVAEPDGVQRRLTEARGYDAEGSFSPDGRWIVFASNREAYARELTAAEQEQLERDPSFFAEIYIAAADGSDPRRLTHTAGYDGGPFFMPDGKRIIWRRFDEEGLVADVWTMNLDGSEPRRITGFGSMSWAPYPHPSGQYVFFTSNKLGFENFELYIVDTEGKKEPVRVTYTPGFDGLPVPSPDGRSLAWTTNRKKGAAQIFMARWNHEAALAALADAPDRREPRGEKP